MALLYFDGFDSYTSADLLARYNVVTGAMVIQGGAGRFGSGAIQCNQSGGSEYLTKYFAPRNNYITGIAWLFVLTNHPVAEATHIIQFSDLYIQNMGASNTGSQVEIGIDGNSRIVITRNDRDTVLATGSTILHQSTYYFIEAKVLIDGGSFGSVHVRLNGVDEVSAVGVNTDPQGTGAASRISLRYDNFKVLPSFDDFYVCDNTGSLNSDFLGDVRVETQLPNAQGFHANFSHHGTGVTANYQAVNEGTEDGDGTYIISGTIGDIDSYQLPALSSAADTIFGVQVTTVGRKDDAGTRTLKHLLRISSTDYFGPVIALTDTYTYDSHVYEVNPANSLGWVPSDLSSLEIGVKLNS